ncbi:MAG TPA: glycoside hydrolase family 3 N-terminal domain-containing protein [Candidatus Limnocylindria bacterium]
MPPQSRLSRRALLAGALGGGAALLAACASEALRSVSPSLVPSLGPTGTAIATPTSSATPTVSLEARVAQMLLVGFRGTDTASAASAIADIRDRSLGGVVLFSSDQPTGNPVRNIVSPDQLAELTAALQSAAGESEAGGPLAISVDEEGGLVARLDPAHGFPQTESAAALGARDDAAYTRAAGKRIAETLKAAGVNLNLAPVVDLDVNADNPIIGALDRSFGADPALVTRQARAFISGHHDVGVLTTLKHFPGHGSSTADSHLGVVDVTRTWSPVELDPYRRLIPAGVVDAILTAHVFNARLDPDNPATLSAATIDGLLRGQLGWDGLVISDDMQMGAIRTAYGYADAVRLAILAGVDVLTIANQQVFEAGIVERTVKIITGQVARGEIPEERIDRSWQRIQAFKARLAA